MRKFLRLLVAFFLMVLVLPPALHAQQKTITGTVLSDDNKTPLSGVTIRVKGTRRIVQTDANGKFTIQVNEGETLQGRVAGVSVTPTTGQAGASSQIVLRGFNTLSLNNQPLFVVDGIILDNSTINETSNGGTALGLASDRPNRNSDYTNRIADLNPADIDQVTVLKGPEATALYGSQASAGAIVITTKRAVTGNFSYYGPRYPEGTKKYDNIGSFFRTGFAQTHNLSADFGAKNVGFRVSGSLFDQKGVVPTNDYKKYNVRLTNTTKIGKYVEFTPSFQYIVTENDKPIRSAGGYLLGLYIWPSNRDIKRFEDENGNKVSAFSADPYAETDNPLYNVNRNRGYDKTNRYIVSGGVNINPFDWLSISGRFGYDHYESEGYTFYHPLSNLTSRTQLGALDNYWRRYNGYNHTITATAKKTVGKFSARLMVGTMWQDYKTEMFAIYGTGLVDSFAQNKLWKNGQVVTDENFGTTVGSYKDSSITRVNTRQRLLRNNAGQYNEYVNRQIAYFGEAALSYNNYIFLSYTRRYEAASVFPKEFRNYNYPGFSLSAIMSDIIPKIKGKVINYWKLRTSLAQTARLANPYSNQSVFVNNFTSSNVGLIYSYGFDNNNPFLSPERQKTYEIGTEVLKLPDAIQYEYYIADTWLYGNARGGLIRGGSTSTITGFHYLRNNTGKVIIDPTTGIPVVEQTFTVIGNRQPDFTLGTLNTMRYKNWSLSFLLDLKVGGDIFNATEMYLTIQGKSKRTLDRETPRVVSGVLRDGKENSSTPTTNTIAVNPYFAQAYYTTMPEEEFVQKDVNFLRLRDLTLAYQVPSQKLNKTKFFKTLSFFVTALSGCFVWSSCAKKLDEAYANPNANVRQPVENILPSMFGSLVGSSSAAGSAYGLAGDGLLVGRYIQYWGTYTVTAVGGNLGTQYDRMGGTVGSSDNLGSVWAAHYYGMGQNLNRIIDWGSEESKWDFVGAAWALRAWSMFEATNEYGEIILRQAFNSSLQTFLYDEQSEVYDSVRATCRRAISFLERTDGN
ncbi:TonB-dependent receptor plug domain protein, partial [Ostertagia ostertagi]